MRMMRRASHARGVQHMQPAPASKGDTIANADARQLHHSVATLRREVAERGARTLAAWKPTLAGSGFVPAATNLAHYLALRRHDLSALQPALSALGLSSLGRSEARVLTALDALLATLSRLAGMPHSHYPDAVALAAGPALLAAAQAALFGPAAPDGPTTRIMVTMPSEAADGPELIGRLLAAGMNCARINCAHDTPAGWAAMISHIRTASKALGRDCRVLMDIAGPKCRIETVQGPAKLRLHRGDRFALLRNAEAAASDDAVFATLNFPDVLDSLLPGVAVWINDGKIGARVLQCSAGRALLEVFSARAKGEKLKPEKGVNLPDTELHLAPLQAADLAALDVIAAEADLVGFSFVQRPADILLLDQELAKRRPGRPPQPVVLKIETPLAVHNMPQLIVTAAATRPVAVMIARGDLAVELGFSRMAEIQEELLWLCEAAHVPVVWATQVLDGLVAEGSPSRAEATDAAMSQRAECVMLNKGPFMVEGIQFLRDILHRMDRHQSKKSARFGPLQSWQEPEIILARSDRA
jgi:pyruvate kinase